MVALTGRGNAEHTDHFDFPPLSLAALYLPHFIPEPFQITTRTSCVVFASVTKGLLFLLLFSAVIISLFGLFLQPTRCKYFPG
jgi:hypothetical protein